MVIRGYGTAVLLAKPREQDHEEYVDAFGASIRRKPTLALTMTKGQSLRVDRNFGGIDNDRDFQAKGAKKRGPQQDPKSDGDNDGHYDEPIDKKPSVMFLACDYFPEVADNYQIWFGATVSARSVKVVRLKTTERDSWWQELRKEIVQNVQAVNCTHVLGYRELLTVCDSVMILSASGTAIKVKKTNSAGQTVARLRSELH